MPRWGHRTWALLTRCHGEAAPRQLVMAGHFFCHSEATQVPPHCIPCDFRRKIQLGYRARTAWWNELQRQLWRSKESTTRQPHEWVWKRQRAGFPLKPGQEWSQGRPQGQETEACLSHTTTEEAVHHRVCCARRSADSFTCSINRAPNAGPVLHHPHFADGVRKVSSLLKVRWPVSGRGGFQIQVLLQSLGF